MNADTDTHEYLVLTPAADGADGISQLTRQTIRSLIRTVGPSRVAVWALAGAAPSNSGCDGIAFWSAGNSRLRIVRRTLTRAAGRADNLIVIVLHVHLAPLGGMLRHRGARLTMFLIGIEVWTRLRARERMAVAAADCLLSISEFTTRGFRQANPDLSELAVATCAPGIPPAALLDGTVEDLPEPGFALIVGRLSSEERYKGHDALIDVWPVVRERVLTARLLIVGDGDDRPRLEAMVAARGLQTAVAFAGRVDDTTLAGLYARAAFFVMPSAREGFGLVYLEAMRAGKPCIAVRGSAAEIIRHGIDGLVLEPGDAAALRDAVSTMFLDESLRRRMGAAASRRVEETFTEAAFGDRLLKGIARSAPRELVHR